MLCPCMKIASAQNAEAHRLEKLASSSSKCTIFNYHIARQDGHILALSRKRLELVSVKSRIDTIFELLSQAISVNQSIFVLKKL